MQKRKIALLGSLGILVIAFGVQKLTNSKDPVKHINLDSEVDSITVKGLEKDILIKSENGKWYIESYEADKNMCETWVKTVKTLNVLNTVGKLGKEEANERYDLTKDKETLVTAYKNGKAIRNLHIGKVSSTGSQTYITLDDKKDILLVTGNLETTFNKTVENIRSRYAYEIKNADVTSVKVETSTSSWSIEPNGKQKENNRKAWKFTSGETREIDSDMVDAWVNNIAICSVSKWLDDSEPLPKTKEATVEITTKDGKILIEVYKDGEGDNARYVCSTNTTSHRFELSEFVSKKYRKDTSELIKK